MTREKTSQLLLRIKPELKEKFAELAWKQRTSMTELLNKMIEKEVKILIDK